MMARILVRAPSRVLIALIGMGLCGAACEISSPGEDRKARLEKLEKIEEGNRVSEKIHRRVIHDEQTFKALYEGRIVPGLGCDICPYLCELSDLRAMDAEDFKWAYRQAAADLLGNARGEQARDLARYERSRLVCIARREPALWDVIAQIYNADDPQELPLTRYMAAHDAVTAGVGGSGPKQALYEVAEGPDEAIAMAARMAIAGWEKLGWPGE
jgi:hypothetical protein